MGSRTPAAGASSTAIKEPDTSAGVCLTSACSTGETLVHANSYACNLVPEHEPGTPWSQHRRVNAMAEAQGPGKTAAGRSCPVSCCRQKTPWPKHLEKERVTFVSLRRGARAGAQAGARSRNHSEMPHITCLSAFLIPPRLSAGDGPAHGGLRPPTSISRQEMPTDTAVG